MNRFSNSPLLFVLVAGAALADGPRASLPEGAEKDTFVKVCSGCHPPEVVVGRLDTSKNWAHKVDTMINRGAEATPEEITQINAYLNNNFAFSPGRVRMPDGPGKQALQKVCGTCHSAEIVVNRDGHAGRRPLWEGTIDRMLQRGAKGSTEDFEQITDYLTANFGYIPVLSYLPEGNGKSTVERVCGPCHGVSLLIDRPSSRSAWERTVANMIGRGAIATPAEAQEISDYLGRYVGPKPERK